MVVVTDLRMDLNDTTRRAHVDGDRWVKRYLSIALAADEIDEKDFHISLALQLLTETAVSSKTLQGGGMETSSDD